MLHSGQMPHVVYTFILIMAKDYKCVPWPFLMPGLLSSLCRDDSANESLLHSGLLHISKHASSLSVACGERGPAKFDKGSHMKGEYR